jgi:Transposase
VAWQGKELQRAVYRAAGPAAARTVRAWQAEILALHATNGCSNGPTEAVNLLMKKVKRVGHGFRNFTNYRLRLLLHCGVRWQRHRTARLRSRSPRSVHRAVNPSLFRRTRRSPWTR